MTKGSQFYTGRLRSSFGNLLLKKEPKNTAVICLIKLIHPGWRGLIGKYIYSVQRYLFMH